MMITTTLAVIALTLAPPVTLAQGRQAIQMQSAPQCAAGQIRHAATSTCTTPVNS